MDWLFAGTGGRQEWGGTASECRVFRVVMKVLWNQTEVTAT